MQDSSLRTLLAVDEREALSFFYKELKEISGPNVLGEDILYNASVLARYSQVSCECVGEEVSCPRDLLQVFENSFGLSGDDISHLNTTNEFEVVATQTLLLTGFFGRQMGKRHNLRWYVSLGSQFFNLAAQREGVRNKRELMKRMSSGFPFWAERYTRLEAELRVKPYLLKIPAQGSVQ